MEDFGNSVLGLVIAAILMVAAFNPEKAGNWVSTFEKARAGLEEKNDDE